MYQERFLFGPEGPCYTNGLQLAIEFAYRDQDRQFAAAFKILVDAIAARTFPGASVAVLHKGRLIGLKGLGRGTYEPGSEQVKAETVFDLASVSKVVATTTAAAILHQRGQLDLNRTVSGREELTVHQLLTHTSGLPAYIRLFERTRDRAELIRLAYATPLETAPGTRTEYSDIGFIILGDVLESIAGESLRSFCQREIFDPLGMTESRFCPPAAWHRHIPPTVKDNRFRHKVIQGEVNDENAWVMGGVAGHAGVFSSAADLARFCLCWLQVGSPILKPEIVIEFTRQQPGTTRAVGWDRPTPPSSSGQYFSSESYGHLGYTGTSIWVDPTRELAVVLLTNRTWPDSNNQTIKRIRPSFHDAVVQEL